MVAVGNQSYKRHSEDLIRAGVRKRWQVMEVKHNWGWAAD